MQTSVGMYNRQRPLIDIHLYVSCYQKNKKHIGAFDVMNDIKCLFLRGFFHGGDKKEWVGAGCMLDWIPLKIKFEPESKCNVRAWTGDETGPLTSHL